MEEASILSGAFLQSPSFFARATMNGEEGWPGWALVKELGRRIGIVKQEPRSTDWLRQRISLAIQRGNAFSILATHPATTTDVLI